MQPTRFTYEKFTSLPLKRQHKNAAEILKLALTTRQDLLDHYNEIASWLKLEPCSSFEYLCDRYHEHLALACTPLNEHHFLPEMKRFDRIHSAPPLKASLYLDHLRSAHNVGAILRTAESFGMCSIGFSKRTPFADHPKVLATSKGTAAHLNCHRDLNALPRPFIALETHQKATSLYDFSFPTHFTLLLGNEEYGLSNELLSLADAIVEIPLFGTKNSLNVASAFAIAAAEISRQLRPCTHSP
ncbi:MAG: TrmH family RNA methyltransferase [Simkaniaceae bacterium]|nr:TrmH family RNA methyltransferase [Simkaniaceae bacterium]MCF7851920.1 TrmH family RNA methyltransferase [Simkaniaceae bacterium]